MFFRYYGARGIVVCERWRESFENFLSDMGPAPEGLTLDRRDNDGPYSPDNCRWATRREQQNNRRVNRMLTFAGATMTMAEWAKKSGIGYKILSNRLAEGWSVERALTQAVKRKKRPLRTTDE